jgi:hypothetical protein
METYCSDENRKSLGGWCLEPESNRYGLLKPADFKSAVSTNFTIEAATDCRRFTSDDRDLSGRVRVLRGGRTGIWRAKKNGKLSFPLLKLERETRLELATSTLARLRSTN